jgi:hypothetical protein
MDGGILLVVPLAGTANLRQSEDLLQLCVPEYMCLSLQDGDFTISNMLMTDCTLENLEVVHSSRPSETTPISSTWQSTTECVEDVVHHPGNSTHAFCGQERGPPSEGSGPAGLLIILRQTRLANNILTASTPNLTQIFYQALQV